MTHLSSSYDTMDARFRLLADRVVVIMQADDQRRTGDNSCASCFERYTHAALHRIHFDRRVCGTSYPKLAPTRSNEN
ncbi:hypothetical protein [Mesorhizobium sp. M0678]|uniref:hypothetical protein n=1 Tax=Mesorhizobium sp. M0678 TaxID=2956985 RepID=UPI003338B289